MFNRKFISRKLVVLAVGSLLSATTTAGVDGGCWNLGTSSLMAAIQPCGIFDCTNGLFGGAFNPCGVPGDPTDDIFVGCP